VWLCTEVTPTSFLLRSGFGYPLPPLRIATFPARLYYLFLSYRDHHHQPPQPAACRSLFPLSPPLLPIESLATSPPMPAATLSRPPFAEQDSHAQYDSAPFMADNSWQNELEYPAQLPPPPAVAHRVRRLPSALCSSSFHSRFDLPTPGLGPRLYDLWDISHK